MTIEHVCIIGPGAIGGMMAVKFSEARFKVSALVRSARVEEISRKGFTLLDGGETFHAVPKVASDSADLGPQDLVILTIKEPALAEVAPKIAPLLKPETQVVQVMNGIPWWFFSHFGGQFQGQRIEAVDPGGCISRHFDISRHVGGVINCGVSILEDGTISHDHSNQLTLGRPDREIEGLDPVVAAFEEAGYNTSATTEIHQAVLDKLQANVSFNPVSALAMATTDLLVSDPLTADLLLALMNEAQALKTALGLDPGPDPAGRIKSGKSRMGPSKTSMLQDVEFGKPLELNGILGAMVEVAGLVDVPVPMARAMFGLLRVREHVAHGQ